MEKKTYDLTASIVLYNSKEDDILHVIRCFLGSALNVKLFLIDNSDTDLLKCLLIDPRIEYVHLGKNIGYGAAHNIALLKSFEVSEYHVILNPDVSFDAHILETSLNYMNKHHDVGMISPAIKFPDGTPQFMCRLLPTPLDLIARRFFPDFLKFAFKDKMDNYLLKDLVLSKKHNIPNLPGSFMFLKNDAIRKVGGFDENYFMYLEDVDLTRRIHQKYKTLYFPEISVVHGLEQGSYKSLKLFKHHTRSAIYYFRKWGWFEDEERESINASLLNSM
jgi:GT2 family glycosyltransferase